MKVCVVSPHFLGHLIPSINAAQALLEGGFRVTFISSRSVLSIFELPITSFGGRCLPSDDGLSESARDLFNISELLSNGLHQIQSAQIRVLDDILTSEGIDAILCDSYLHEIHRYSITKKIPLAVLFQSTFHPMSSTFLGVPVSTFQIGPFFFYSHPFILRILAAFVPFFKFYESGLHRIRDRALLLYTGFVGLESAVFLPPTVRLIGPLLPKVGGEITDQKLNEFLTRHSIIVLVSVGSILSLHQHQLNVLLEGFRKVGIASIWSIQKGVLPKAEDIFVSNWIPQFECLSHDSVKFFVSHCGFGGVLESIRTGKPILCLPFFGDAHQNADLIVRANAGLYLHKTSQSETSTLEKAQNYFTKSRFTAQEVEDKTRLLIQNDNEFYRGMIRLQKIANAIDSRGELCRQIKILINIGEISYLYPIQKKVNFFFPLIVLLVSLFVWLSFC
jgi:UDP:flavonoid glycosyltransferase YjiC (YdhE family)